MTIIACNVLRNHINRPFNNRTLPVQHGRGIVTDADGASAIKIAFALDGRERIVDAAFRSFGDPLLIGCGSFLTEVLRGQTLDFALQVTADELACRLQLAGNDARAAVMAVRALWRALSDYRRRRPPLLY